LAASASTTALEVVAATAATARYHRRRGTWGWGCSSPAHVTQLKIKSNHMLITGTSNLNISRSNANEVGDIYLGMMRRLKT